VETLLALEMVRVTEAAALASARFMGRGETDEADQAATDHDDVVARAHSSLAARVYIIRALQ